MLPLTVASLYLGPTWGRLEGRLRAVNRSLRSGRCAPTLTTAPLFHDERPGEGCGLLRATLGAHDAGQGNRPVTFPPGHLTGQSRLLRHQDAYLPLVTSGVKILVAKTDRPFPDSPGFSGKIVST